MSEIVHGTALLIASQGVLIRGRSGAGKSMLAQAFIERGARLIADDRVGLAACNGRVIATAPAAIAGLIELRGRGLVAVPHERFAPIGLVADIMSEEPLQRMPDTDELTVEILGIALPRQPVPTAIEHARRLIEAALTAQLLRRNMGLRSAQV